MSRRRACHAAARAERAAKAGAGDAGGGRAERAEGAEGACRSPGRGRAGRRRDVVLHGPPGRSEGGAPRGVRREGRRGGRRHGRHPAGHRPGARDRGAGDRPRAGGSLPDHGDDQRLAVNPADRVRREAPGHRDRAEHSRLPGPGRRAADGVLRRVAARLRTPRRTPGGGGRPGRPAPGRHARDLLLGHQQHRFRDRRREPRRGGRARHLRPALLPRAHGHPDRAGDRRGARHRQRDGGRAFPRRHLRPLDAHAVARLAVHRRGRVLRRTARGGDPRAGGGPDARPAALPERAGGRLHRRGLARRVVDQGRPDGGRLRPRHPGRPRGQPADADQPRERGVPPGSGLRAPAHEREDVPRAGGDLRGEGLLSRAALRRHGRGARRHGRLRDDQPAGDARAGALRSRCAPAGRHLGERPFARREGRRRDRRHRGLPPGDRGAPGDLPPDGLLRHLRHAGPSAGHRARRPAPSRHRARAPRPNRGLPGRGPAQGR